MNELINNTEEELTQGIYRSYAVANNAAQQQLTPEESLSVLENQDKLPMSASFYNQNKEAYQQDNENSLTNEFYRRLEENSRLYDISSDASTFAIAKNYYNNLEQIDNAFQKIVNYEKQSFLGRVTDDFKKANAQFEVNAFARQINDKRRNGEDVTADLEELERRNQAVANMAGSHKMSIAQSTASVLASAWQTKETLAASTAGAMANPILGGAIGIAGTMMQTKEMEYNATVAELMREGDIDPEDIHLVADVYSNVSSFIEAAGFTAGAAPIMSTFAKGLKNLAMKGGKKTLLDVAKKVSTKEGAIQVVKYMLGGGSLNALAETAEEVLQGEAAEVVGGMSPEDLQSPDYLKIGRETYTKTWNDVSKLATKLMNDKKLLDEEQELWDLIRFTYAGSYISTAPTAAVGKAMSLHVQNQKVESAENKLNEGRANLNLTMDIKKAIIESDINKKNPKAFDVIFKKIADANGADGKVYVTADALREALEKVQNNEEVIKLFQESGVIDALNNAVDGKIELDYATAKNTILSEQAEEVYNQIIGDIAWDSKTMTPNESIESFSNSVVDKLSGVASEKVAELEEKLLNSMGKKGTKEKKLAHANAVMALHAANALHNANPERSLEDYLNEVVSNLTVGDKGIDVDRVIQSTLRQGDESMQLAQEMNDIDRAEAEAGVPMWDKDTIEINGVERAVTNSAGERIAQSEKSLRMFYEWFGDSKAVNEKGEPINLYHGTRFDFSAFDGIKPIFLSDNRDVAVWFAIYGKGNSAGNIKTVYAKLENPLVIDAKGNMFGDIDFEGYRFNAETIASIAKERGYDGLIINNVKEAGSEEILSNDYVAFSPNQIKSTSNRGTFSKASDDIFLQDAYHGTPHNELVGGKFSLEKISTGEGHQAHGWGLYFALQRGIAESYRKKLAESKKYQLIKSKAPELDDNDIRNFIEYGRDFMESFYEKRSKNPERYTGMTKELAEQKLEAIKRITDEEIEEIKGQVYKVDVPDNPFLLHEDDRYGQQPAVVKKAINDIIDELTDEQMIKITEDPHRSTEDRRKYLRDSLRFEGYGYDIGVNADGRGIYKALTTMLGSKRAASEMLERHGVKGIFYYGLQDEYCFVIFNDKDVKVLDKFYQAIESKQSPTAAGYFDPATLEIRLTSASNPTTFAHELMHYFMFNMVTYYNNGTMTEEWRKEFEKAMKWAGAEKDSEGKYSFDASDPKVKAAQEKLAEGFTSYLLKGEAPSQNTKGLFNTFKTWFKAVYAKLRMNKVRLNQDVTRFYDKIFSVDGDIEMLATQEKLGMMEKPDGVTDEQWAAYQQAKEDAKDAANSEALKIIAKRTKIQSEQAYKDVFDKFYNEKMAELKEDPAYTARAEMLRVKVSEESVERIASKGALNKKFIATDKDIANPESEVIGEDIEVLANRFGFGDNILEFIDWVNTAESEKATAEEYAREMADAWIDENYPELREVSPEHALRNIAAMKVNIYEYMILNKIPFNQFNVIFNEMTKTVEAVCATMSNKELANTDKLEQRLKSVLNRTISLQNSNSTKGLASLKYRAAMLNYMIDISKAARGRIIGFSRHFNKYKKFPTNANLRTIDGQAWNLILDVLNKHGITRRHTASPDIKARLADFINRVLDMSYSDVKNLEGFLDVLVNVKGTDFATMPFGDFVQLNEALRDIEAIGKKIKEIIAKNEKMLIEDAEQSISEYAKQNKITVRNKDDKGIKKFRNWWMSGVSIMETQLKEIMPDDLFRKYILPFFEGMSYAVEWKNNTSKRILQIITPVLKHQSRLINVDGNQLTVLEGLVVLLNSGNKHNKRCIAQTLFEKKGIETSIEAIIQEIPDAMRAAGVEVDVRDIVQAVWDVFEEAAPAMKEAQIQLNGREVNLIEPESITFADGKVLRGGYYPAKGTDYTGDPKSVKDTSEFIKKTFSFTLDRTGQVHGDLPLDLTMLTSWVGQMGKLLFVANPANNIEKLANSKAIKAVWGDERISNIKEWLALSILPERIDPVIAKLASIGSILTLGGNIAKFFVQAFGFTAAIGYTGLHIVPSLAKCMNPVMWRMAYRNARSKSAYMRNRYSDPLNHLYNAKSVESMFNSAISQGFDKAATVFMSAVTLGDNFASTVVWDAIYNKSIAEGLSEQEAIMSADSAVRITQGDTSHGSRPKAIQGWKRLLSPFCSYFLAVHNIVTAKLQKSTPESIFEATIMLAMYGMVVPYCEAIFSSYINYYGYSDEDKKKRRIKGLSQFRKDSQIENIISSSFNIALPVGGVASYPAAVALKFFDKEGYTNPTVIPHQPIIKLTKVLTAFVGKYKGKGKTDPIKEVEKLFGVDKMIRSGRSLENIVTNFFD